MRERFFRREFVLALIAVVILAGLILASRSIPSGPTMSDCYQIEEPCARAACLEEYYRIYGQTYEQ
ncbi:MAG: hypothetical protein ACE5LG_09705 [Anaerolineae bacterium]